MRLRHPPAQVQAQTDAAAAACARAVGAVEGLSPALQQGWRDARAVVAQAEGQLSVGLSALGELWRQRRVGGVAAGVLDQVAQQRAQAYGIGLHRADGFVQVEG